MIQEKDINPYRYLTMAKILRFWKDFEQSRVYYEKAIKVGPDFDDLYYQYGLELQQEKKHDIALTKFQKADELSAVPNATYLMEIAYSHQQLKHVSEADEFYLKAIENDDNDASIRYYYGKFLKEEERYKQGLEQLLAATKITPESAEYTLYVAYFYEKLGDKDNANMYYHKAMELDKGSNGKYYTWYGQFLVDELRDYEQAKAYFTKAMKVDPKSFSVYYQFAKLLRDHDRDYIKAKEYYLKIFDLNNGSNKYHASYGYLLYLMGEYDDAMKHILLEMKEDDSNHWAYYYHALVNNVQGNHKEAEESLAKAADLITKNKDKKTALNHLKVIKSANELNQDLHEKYERMIVSKMFD